MADLCEPWPFACPCCQIDGASPTVTGWAVEAATEVLWALSGRQFGECTATVLPCPTDCTAPSWASPLTWVGSWPAPALVDGLWYNLGCAGSCHGDCSCVSASRFTLPGAANGVVSISIGGVPVPTGSYRVLDSRIVERTDGGSWPSCNDGTWLADVRYGDEVPRLGLLAAAELACEFVKACTPGQTCRLPARLAAITRQGVSKSFRGSEGEFAGKIGLYLSDLFIETFNPNGLAENASIASPDVPWPHVVT